MVGRPYDCLANPLGAVRLTFEKAVGSGLDPTTLDGKDWGATNLFHEFLFDNGGLSQVPLLNSTRVHFVQSNTLVRFRGMIQDMLGNEFYVGAYKDGEAWNTNKFTDICQFPVGPSPDMRVWERRLLYCVPVPGQNSWTECPEVVVNPCMNSISPNREKRPRDNVSASTDVVMQDSGELPSSPSAKKMREGESPLQESKSEGTCSNMSMVPDLGQKYFPCLVKIYDSPESDLKLNDVYEFIGVLTFDPEVTVDKDDSNDVENGFRDEELVQLPSSKVPRLHCLLHRKLSVNDFFLSLSTLEPKPCLVRGVRDALLHHLTAALGDDAVAAHFMLLHLLSKVHARVESYAVGKLSLNITGFSKESISIFGDRINHAVKNLLPFTHYVPLTVDYLNTASFAPVKDYQTNRLVSGVLQLAEGSHLTIDETPLQAGTLNATGVDNTSLLKNLLEFQKVDYDFKYYKMKMDADVQLLILSEGKSNILPADLVLPFRPTSVGSLETVDADTLKAWRWYLATLKSLPHSIGTEMQKVVEDDLVAARQMDRSLGSEDFSRWLTMGRLMSVSFGETTLSLEHWQMVQELERLRKERFQSSQAASISCIRS